MVRQSSFFFFFFNDTATTEIYTLSLHDALPICIHSGCQSGWTSAHDGQVVLRQDRKSTRLNSSHSQISYAVFCLKKKKKHKMQTTIHPTRNEQYSQTHQDLARNLLINESYNPQP